MALKQTDGVSPRLGLMANNSRDPSLDWFSKQIHLVIAHLFSLSVSFSRSCNRICRLKGQRRVFVIEMTRLMLFAKKIFFPSSQLHRGAFKCHFWSELLDRSTNSCLVGFMYSNFQNQLFFFFTIIWRQEEAASTNQRQFETHTFHYSSLLNLLGWKLSPVVFYH